MRCLLLSLLLPLTWGARVLDVLEGLLGAESEVDGKKRTCARVGCNAPYNKEAKCQCRPGCMRRKDCCEDYKEECIDKATTTERPTTTKKSIRSDLPCPPVDSKSDDSSNSVPYIPQEKSCFEELPYSNRSLPVTAPSPEELQRVKDNLEIYVFNGRFHKHGAKNGLYMSLCLSLFPGGVPIVWPVSAESKPVCVIAKAKQGVEPVFWSDYNPKRGTPNFVAYLNRGLEKQATVNRDWRRLPGFGDKEYSPGEIVKKRFSEHCQGHGDCACPERVSARGHLATMSQHNHNQNSAQATNTYVNTVPTRQPFDGHQWNAREQRNAKYAEEQGRPVFVVKGPSLESDGMTDTSIEVPSMLWTAVYDEQLNKATSWTCRNGLRQPRKFKDAHGLPAPVGCFCADGLPISAIQGAVGIKLWPGVRNDIGKLKW